MKFKVIYRDVRTNEKRVKIVDGTQLDTITQMHEVDSCKEIPDLSDVSYELLLLHAVLLLRTINRYETKEWQLKTMRDYYSKEDLLEYIYHFDDPVPEINYETLAEDEAKIEDVVNEYLSSTAGDYGPSCPWKAPGMSIHDFI